MLAAVADAIPKGVAGAPAPALLSCGHPRAGLISANEGDGTRRCAVCAAKFIAPQAGPQSALLSCAAGEVLYGGAVGGGKGVWIDEEIPTPTGYRRMGDLADGDLVFDETGRAVRVLRAHPVRYNLRCYRVAFDDGSSVIVDEDHLWTTQSASERAASSRRTQRFREARRLTRKPRGTGKRPDLAARNAATPRPCNNERPDSVRNMQELIATLRHRGGSNHSVDVAAPLQYVASCDLPIDPYLLGLWLGDGTEREGTITTTDPEILEAFRDRGIEPYQSPSQQGGITWSLRGFTSKLRAAGVLGHKHVPAIYLQGSAAQRLELLRGLMDTDGGCAAGSVEFTNTRRALAEAVRDLACSLGHKLSIREGRAVLHGRDCGPKWTLKWTPADRVFHLRRKATQQRQPSRGVHRRRYIIAIDEVSSVPTRCLTVDSERSLYLVTRACIPTHNTWGLSIAPLRWVHLPAFSGLILRRESTQFADVLKKTRAIYPLLFPGSRFHSNPRGEPPHWRFPSGAKLYLSHCKDEDDKYNFQGIEFQFIAFDELTHFTKTQFDEISIRCRGVVPGLPTHVRHIRCSANPGGAHAEWVKRHWAPWLDSRWEHPNHPRRYDGTGRRLPPIESGRVLWFVRNERTGIEEVVPAGTRGATSRTYIKSLLWDNPILMQQDPHYLDRLRNRNDPVRFQQIVYGDWEVQEGKGLYFPRAIWRQGKIRSAPPSRVVAWVRCWDLACSEAGDYAVGAKVGICEGGELWIADVVRRQGDPGTIDRLVIDTAKRDKRKVPIVIEQEPGSGGKFTIFNLARELHGYDVEALRPDESKIDRARPLSAQYNLGNVYMKAGIWNDDLIDELNDFPHGLQDDQVDACSGAYYVLADEEEDREAADETPNAQMRRRLRRIFRTQRL